MDTNLTIDEIRNQATNKRTDIDDLLRKSLLFASANDLTEFQQWIENELFGYKQDPIPTYRKVASDIKLRTPYRGLIPFYITDPKIAEQLQNFIVVQPVGQLCAIVNNLDKDPSGVLYGDFSPEQTAFLMESQSGTHYPPTRIITRLQIEGIIDSVRNELIRWTLDLKGYELSIIAAIPQDHEKKDLTGTQNIHIENFQGVFGNIADSTLNQNLEQKVKKNDFDSLRNFLRACAVEETDLDELQIALREDPLPDQIGNFGHSVSEWIGKMVKKSALGVWKIGVDVAGQVLAIAIAQYYGIGQVS